MVNPRQLVCVFVFAAACGGSLGTPAQDLAAPDLAVPDLAVPDLLPTCPGAEKLCGGSCRDLTKDSNHCGACDKSCPLGQQCSNSVCSCPPATPDSCVTDLGAFCTNRQIDQWNCGSCGNHCGSGTVCEAGSCVTTCSPAYASCPVVDPTYCAKLSQDANNCGECGLVCPSGQQCVSGVCVCPSATPDACSPDAGSAGFCTNLKTDGANCGSCGKVCTGGAGCVDGECVPCNDTTSDPNNCGACGYKCVNGRSCVNSRCTPAWQPIATLNAPAARHAHAAVGFGGKYLTFGGTLASNGAGAAVNTGGTYDPTTDAWSSLPALASARCNFAAATSGSKVYAFGGLTNCADGTTIGPSLEEFAGTSWASVSTGGAVSPRYNLPMVWTGTQLFLYGGSTNSQPAVASGGRFDPTVPAWSAADCALTSCERGGDFGMFVDGSIVRVWGGGPYGDAPAGLAYDLTQSTWSAWPLPSGTPTLPKRYADDGRRIYFLNPTSGSCPHSVEVLIYDRKTSSWLPKDSATPPTGLLSQAEAAWVGSEMIAWSGNCGAGASTVGGRYQPPAPK